MRGFGLRKHPVQRKADRLCLSSGLGFVELLVVWTVHLGWACWRLALTASTFFSGTLYQHTVASDGSIPGHRF